jgi:4-hydroxybenzoate polyprenyltransferase
MSPSLFRPHIVAIAGLAAVVFGWVLTGGDMMAAAQPRLRVPIPMWAWVAGGLAAFDWCVLNLFNRIADVPEDERNGVAGTSYVRENVGFLMRGAFVALAVSLIGAQPFGFPLLALRLIFHAGGFVYSFPTVGPRVKEIFLVKNVFSGMLFILSVIGYPLAISGAAFSWPEIAFLCAFFLPLEVTYELIYDLRDVEGDAASGIVTLPVKWGAPKTRAFIELLLALSASSLLAGYLLGVLRWRELVMIAAPLQQALILRFWIPRDVRKSDAIGITWLGAAQLASYVGWVLLGLPLERPW